MSLEEIERKCTQLHLTRIRAAKAMVRALIAFAKLEQRPDPYAIWLVRPKLSRA